MGLGFLVVPSNRTRDNSHKLEHGKVHVSIRALESGRALEQDVQRGYGVSFFGDCQKPSWILSCATYCRFSKSLLKQRVRVDDIKRSPPNPTNL